MSDQGVTKWKMVPVEPTPEMIREACSISCRDCHLDCEQGPYAAQYKAMLRAAPTPPPPPSEDELGRAIYYVDPPTDDEDGIIEWDEKRPNPKKMLAQLKARAILTLLNRGR